METNLKEQEPNKEFQIEQESMWVELNKQDCDIMSLLDMCSWAEANQSLSENSIFMLIFIFLANR